MIETTTSANIKIVIPKSFRSYEMIKEIGKGGFSAVFLIRDKRTFDKYAAKVIPKKNVDGYTMKSIETEVQILKSIDHPYIIKFHDSFNIKNDNDDEYFIIITEYCEKGNLIEVILNSKMNVTQKTHILQGICSAIEYLHNIKKIAHCDIKLDNILVDSKNRPKLCDFGLCQIDADNYCDHCGTIMYTAPELYKIESCNAFKADIYSLGIVLYAFYEEEMPYKSERIKPGYFNIKKYMNQQIKDLFVKCTQYIPDNRPTIEQILQEPIFFTDFERIQQKHNPSTEHEDIIPKTNSSTFIDEIPYISISSTFIDEIQYEQISSTFIDEIQYEQISSTDFEESFHQYISFAYFEEMDVIDEIFDLLEIYEQDHCIDVKITKKNKKKNYKNKQRKDKFRIRKEEIIN